jgi:hypothetical protein
VGAELGEVEMSGPALEGFEVFAIFSVFGVKKGSQVWKVDQTAVANPAHVVDFTSYYYVVWLGGSGSVYHVRLTQG